MNKELSKAVMRFQLETKYIRTKQEADRNAYKKQRNRCVKLRWEAVKQHFVNKCQSGIMIHKNLWKTLTLKNLKGGVQNDPPHVFLE